LHAQQVTQSWPAESPPARSCGREHSRGLGVSQFGQSGDISDLYPHHGVAAETIVGAALDLCD
jgi:pyruvate dehydrogenase complex dehydrogenase (E1) component